MSADSPRRSNIRGVPAVVPPEEVSDRSIIDSVAGFINDVTLANQPIGDPKDTIIWARFESAADISDPRFGDDWELEGNVAPPLLLILGYGLGVQIWAIPANGEAVEVLSWRHGIVSALRILPKPVSGDVSRADEPIDLFSDRRPLMAICDGGPSSQGGSNPQFCSVNFLSLRTGTQVKTIKFKNPVLDILANRTSVVVTFHERIAIFDARTLEDRLTVTTCFPSPGINPNPVALGSRWLAYSENKLLSAKRSGGGCDGDGVASYTATVLNAAKSLGKGLREFTEQVTAGLTGTTGSGTTSKSASFDSCGGDIRQPGIVTILDIKYAIKDMSPTSGTPISVNGTDPIVAHFIAHSEAIVAMEFDNSGMMLLTADKRGHNFHVFRIQPHPVGSTLAAVHHLYVLHRGDTSAKVQNISFSLDTRWVAVSTLRGTTHVFPITPYGGPPTARTHSNLHVVNKLSSFHHSAGLTADGRSSSPISHTDTTNFSQQLMPYFNQTMPPFPRPTVVLPLAQLRQPFTLSNNAPATAAAPKTERGNRQRLSSLSDDNGKPLSVCAVFAKSRSWLLDPPNLTRDGPAHKLQRKAVDSLFVMAGHGALIQYDLDVSYVAKDKKCDDKSIDLDVEAKAQWNVGRRDPNTEIMPPLPSDNWLVKDRMSCALVDSSISDDVEDRSDCWLAQVEIITHAGPSRRLWMGPQFVFKTYNTPSGSSLSHIDSEAVEIGMTATTKTNPERSSPLNMPVSSGNRSSVPVLIESGSYSSIEQSPKLMDRFRHDYLDSDYSLAHGESRLKEDLADAMRESPSVTHKNTGLTPTLTQTTVLTTSQTSSESSQSYHQIIENVVNPLGTVTTVNLLAEAEDPLADNPYVKFSPEDYVIHENCDESLFRPVVVFCDNKKEDQNYDQNGEFTKPPALIENKLVVPVIDKSLHMVLTKKEAKRAEDKFEELSNINKMSKSSAPAQEDIKVKEEVVISKGKKNKKKVAELTKEPTPPRETKKSKKDEISESQEASVKKPEKVKEVTKADVKPIEKDEIKIVKQESVKVKKEATEVKKAPVAAERKNSIKLEATSKSASKTVERKKSLEPEEEGKLKKEGIPEAKPRESPKPVEKIAIEDEPEEVVVTLKKKGKNKKEVLPVKQEESDSTSSEEPSLPSVKDMVVEGQDLVLPKDKVKKAKEKSPPLEEKVKTSIVSIEDNKVSKDNKKGGPSVEKKEQLVTVVQDKKKDDIELKEKKSKEETSVKEESLEKPEQIKGLNKKLKVMPCPPSKEVEEDLEEIAKEEDEGIAKKGKNVEEDLQKKEKDVEEDLQKKEKDVKEDLQKKEKDVKKDLEKKAKEDLEKKPSSKKDIKEDIEKTSIFKEITVKKEKSPEAPAPKVLGKEAPAPKTIEPEAQAGNKKPKSKKQSRESSPEIEEVAPSPKTDNKPKETTIEIPDKDPVESPEPTTTNKKKNKNKKASRESSPELPSRKNSLKEVKPIDLSELVQKTETTVEIDIEPKKEEEPTVTIKKKNKNKKASRESSPELPSRKNSLKDVKPVDLSDLSEKTTVPEAELTVTIKKKNKNKKASRESSPEPPSTKNSLKDITSADDNLLRKTKSNDHDKSDDQEYKVTVREISPSLKEVPEVKRGSSKEVPEAKKNKDVSVKESEKLSDIKKGISKEVPTKEDLTSSKEIPSIKKESSKEVSTKEATKDVSSKDQTPTKKALSKDVASSSKEVSLPALTKEVSPPKEEPKITDFLKFVDHFNKKPDTNKTADYNKPVDKKPDINKNQDSNTNKTLEPEDHLYKVTVKDISPPETDNDFPSLSFSTKKSKKNKKSTQEMTLPIEKEPEPVVETLSPFQPLDKITPAEEGATLINFESPESTTKINLLDFERPKGFPDDIIFAICGHLSDPNEPIDEFLTSSSTASASEETTDETAATPEKKKKTKKLVSPCNVNDDEELRPLISTTADIIESTPTPEVLYPCKYSEKDAKSSDSSSDTGGGSYTIPETAVVPPQHEQQPTNQQHQNNSKKKIKRRKR